MRRKQLDQPEVDLSSFQSTILEAGQMLGMSEASIRQHQRAATLAALEAQNDGLSPQEIVEFVRGFLEALLQRKAKTNPARTKGSPKQEYRKTARVYKTGFGRR